MASGALCGATVTIRSIPQEVCICTLDAGHGGEHHDEPGGAWWTDEGTIPPQGDTAPSEEAR